MKIICNHCGKILDLMTCTSFAIEEAGQLKAYYFCSPEHMDAFTLKKGLTIQKN